MPALYPARHPQPPHRQRASLRGRFVAIGNASAQRRRLVPDERPTRCLVAVDFYEPSSIDPNTLARNIRRVRVLTFDGVQALVGSCEEFLRDYTRTSLPLTDRSKA